MSSPNSLASRSKSQPQVLHVTESLAGGVLAAVRDYVRNTPGVAHHLLYRSRADAPLHAGDLEGFSTVSALPDGHLARLRATRRARSRLAGPAVVHAHSSFAGAYTRLAVARRSDTRIVYTPHCYAFERQDISRSKRAIYRGVERLLSVNTSIFAACSPREADLSRWRGDRTDIVVLPNVSSATALLSGVVRSDERTLIVGSGRNGPQKDPHFFAECVMALRQGGGQIDAVWIGGDDSLAEAFEPFDIRVTGWLSRIESLELLAAGDLYIHSAQWEGFPVALLEAAAVGVPALVRDIPAFEGVDLPFTFTTPAELRRRSNEFTDSSSREALVQRLRQSVQLNSDARQAHVLQNLYDLNLRTR